MTRLRKFLLLLLACAWPVVVVHAQSVIITSPLESTLNTVTPKVSVRAIGLSTQQRPLRFTLYVTRNSTGDSPYVDSVSVMVNDSTATILVSKLLPSFAVVYLKVRVTQPSGTITDSQILGPYQLPRWLTLIKPNDPQGNQLVTRRPTFVWQSAKVDPVFGTWKYDLQIFNNERGEQGVAGLTDTTFTPSDELYANASYTWQVHAYLQHGEEVTVGSISSFGIRDPSVPTTTLIYQNFPNPFPSPISFSTCFWFDIGASGARVSLDVLDLHGNLVRNIVPPTSFPAGTYGRGAGGSGGNCDNRFVWDGTASDGRSVPRGIYYLRFIANGGSPALKKIVFLGR